MHPRINYYEAQHKNAFEGLRAMERYARSCGLEMSLIELMKTRASQVNGCAFCIDMHTKDARAAGETEQRLYSLSAWREAPLYSDRERAALEWTEALTLIRQGVPGVTDDLYDRVRAQFSEPEIVNLTAVVVTINAWNRLAISLRFPVPGSYSPSPRP
jgi:AhpD family alkylhydroperoxidase